MFFCCFFFSLFSFAHYTFVPPLIPLSPLLFKLFCPKRRTLICLPGARGVVSFFSPFPFCKCLATYGRASLPTLRIFLSRRIYIIGPRSSPTSSHFPPPLRRLKLHFRRHCFYYTGSFFLCVVFFFNICVMSFFCGMQVSPPCALLFLLSLLMM